MAEYTETEKQALELVALKATVSGATQRVTHCANALREAEKNLAGATAAFTEAFKQFERKMQ